MTRASNVTIGLKLIFISLTGLMVACGGGGGSSTPENLTTITGSVIAAPVDAASLTVKDSSGSTVAGPVTTGSDGTYSVDVPDSALSGELVFESTGGTFNDEATSLNRDAGKLAARVAGGSLSTGSAVHLTPASTIVQYLVSNHGNSLTEAQAAFKAAFGYAVDTSVAPADATNPAADATPAQLLAGLRAAAFSQLTFDLTLMAVDQFTLLADLARDIAHGGLDGLDADGAVTVIGSKAEVTLPADIQFQFFLATLNFHSGTHNKTGLASNELGSLPFVAGYVVGGASGGVEINVEDTDGIKVAGPITVGSGGIYGIDFSSLPAIDLVFKSTAGSFGVMTAYVPSGSLAIGSMVHLSPASTIVQTLVNTYSIPHADALVAFETAFGFALDTSIKPVDATKEPPSGTGQPQLLAGLRAAAFAQLATELPLELPALLPDLALDIADGTFGGGDLTPIDIQNRFTQALVNTHKATMAKTGLGNDQIGSLPFAKVALSNLVIDGSLGLYKIEYMPGMMAAMEGKTMFTLRISNISDNLAATGLNVSLMPMMHMASMGMGMDEHGTPVGGCTEDVGVPGDYDCTVYYLMASKMMNGMSMGYWNLMVMVGMDESTTFYPQVGMAMAMGDTPKAVLTGQDDVIAGMMGDEKRTYYLFKDSNITGPEDNHTFKLFIAAKEYMMSYPAVSTPMTLRGNKDLADTTYDLNVTAVTVEVSVDGSNWDTITVTEDIDTDGHWTATGIPGLLNDGTKVPLYVRLTVNGIDINSIAIDEQKTTDGMTPAGDGSNDYATFMLTTPAL